MPFNVHVIPEWTDFAPRLVKTIQQRGQQRDVFNQNEQEDTLFLKVHPSVQYHYSCAPLHHLHCITSYSSGSGGNVVLGFRWCETEFKHQIDTWVDEGQGILRHLSTVPVHGRFKMELMLFVPSRVVLVAYCDDMYLRLLTDKTQEEMVPLCQAVCPAAVASMHYCAETGELLTGSMGLVAFWGFFTSAQSALSLLRVLDWTCSSLQRGAIVSCFVAQPQTSSVYLLCYRNIKSLEHAGKKEQFEFQGQSVSTLRCGVAEWRQRYLYTGDAEGYMQVWSYDTRRLFLQFRAHTEAVTSVVLLPESGTVLSASTGCWIKQWTCTGDLLLKLHTDMRGVRSMWKLDKNVILCQSSNALDAWRLTSVYRSFNDTACGVRVLRRLDCGGGKARILAVTQDGIIRFFSPVTGELLFLSWPFLHIDKALGFAYDPVQEELYICDGSVEVLVLNTTLSPCPVKHVISTDSCDGVMCLATVLLHWRLPDDPDEDSPPRCLVFSGHCNGKLQLLAPLSLTCTPQQAHMGAICQMSSNEDGETPLICCFGNDKQFTLWSISCGERRVDLILHRQIHCRFTPVHCRVLKGFICAVSPQQDLIFYSLHTEESTLIERKASERIWCLDYCPQLDVVAVSGESGKVEVWNLHGDLVSEIQLGVPVTQVCFGNARGDILASFSDSISAMSVVDVLPPRYLRAVLQQAPPDDLVEVPTPFLPKSPSHYDISLVTKIYLKCVGVERAGSETSRDSSTCGSMSEGDTFLTDVQKYEGRKSVVKPFMFRKQSAQGHTESPPPDSEQELAESNKVSGETFSLEAKSLEEESFYSFFSHIAQGGYIPNSVVRATHDIEQLEETDEGFGGGGGLPVALLKDFSYLEDEDALYSDQNSIGHAVEEILTRSKLVRMINAQQQQMVKVDAPVVTPEERKEEVQHPPAETPVETKEDVIKRISTMMEDLDTTSEADYKRISGKLLSLLHGIRDRAYVKDQMVFLRQKLVSHATDGSIDWRQTEGLNNLRRLCLLHHGDISAVTRLMIHPHPRIRDVTSTVLKSDFKIYNKKALRKKLEGLMSSEELEALLALFTYDLNLIESDQNDVATSGVGMTISDNQQSKPTTVHVAAAGMKKCSTISLPQMPADMKVQRRMSRKTNKMFDDRRSSTKGDFVRAKEKEHKEEVEEEKKKTDTEIVTAEESKSSREVHYATPKASKRKKKLASKKRINFSAAGRPHFSTDNPLLYAYRKACIDSLDMSSSTGLASMLKHESRLLPFDSGFMSLENQEVSKQLPAAGQGGLVPIGQKPKRVFSKAHKLTSQHVYQPPHPSPQHHLGPTQYDVIGQPRHDITSQHSDIIAQRYDMQHPHTVHHDDDGVHYPRDHRDVHFQHCHDNNLQGHYVTTQHYDIIITSQRPCEAIRSDITPSFPPGRTEHAQGPCYPPRPPVSQAPHSSRQHDPKPRPHEASLAADQLVEQGKALEQGDAGHWRESLHKLISLHGFRSCKAAQATASLQQQQARSKTSLPPLRSKTALPPLRYQPPGSAVPGERVLEKVELTGQDGGSSTSSSFMPPLQFQQQIPLSWRLSHASLKPRGQVRYGRLEMDWVSGGARGDIASATLKTPTLPKIKPRRRRPLTQA